MIIIALLILFYIVVAIGVIYMIKIAKIFFELKDLDYSGENAVFTLKKEDSEAYLIIRIAPNVHITDKEGL